MRDEVAARLSAAGFLAAGDEATRLVRAAAGDADLLEELLARRLTGEPLAWIVGTATFAGLELCIHPGVYVPRPHTEALARRAVGLLPEAGVAIDVCCGSGAIAAVLGRDRPAATVLGTDLDPVAVACARSNGVDALAGDLLDPVPADLVGRVDLVVGVVPYVPTGALGLLHRDTLAFESPVAYDGGPDGTDLLARLADDARRVLRAGGHLLVELGGDQATLLADRLDRLGYEDIEVLVDGDGDVRAIAARRRPSDADRPER